MKGTEFLECVETILLKKGADREATALVGETLLDAHRTGYGSHGMSRIPMYCTDIDAKTLDPTAKPTIERETPATAVIDGNWGFGIQTMDLVVKTAVEKAKHSGIAVINTIRTNDIARLGGYVEKVAEQDLIGVLMVNDGGANSAVAPTGSSVPFFSTNPLAAGIPTPLESPIIIDISTGTVAIGKLRDAMNTQTPIPEGWLVNTSGESVTDPSLFFKSPPAAAILPIGGILAGHKGYSLSLLVDILAGGLAGTGLSCLNETREANGVFLLAINPEVFDTLDHFKQRVGTLINDLKTLGNIRIPGERGYQMKQALDQEIEIDPVTLEKIRFLLKTP